MYRISAGLFLAVLCAVPGLLSAEPGAENQAASERYRLQVLSEVNFARTDPSGYAQKRLAQEYSARQDNGAYVQLVKARPVPALALNPLLSKAADGYAKFLAAKNRFGHNEKGSPSDRIRKAGYEMYAMGENIACGSFPGMNADETPDEAAVMFVKQWIIDEGVPGAGHRKNILSTMFTEIGVGFGHNPRSKYVNYTVQDFGSQK